MPVLTVERNLLCFFFQGFYAFALLVLTSCILSIILMHAVYLLRNSIYPDDVDPTGRSGTRESELNRRRNAIAECGKVMFVCLFVICILLSCKDAFAVRTHTALFRFAEFSLLLAILSCSLICPSATEKGVKLLRKGLKFQVFCNKQSR